MIRSIFLIALLSNTTVVQGQKLINKIAFGSCSHEYDEDQMWPEISAEKADIFIWTGDIIYGDSNNMDTLAAKYKKQKERASYQALLEITPIIGIWDDHDYGANDGGKNYKPKKASKEQLLKFLDVPKNNPVRNHEGMYNVYTYGPEGKRIKFILLDCRYFRDTLTQDTQTGARYKQNFEGDILGEEQWNWLEHELTNSDAQLNILVSGIQILAEEHGFEKWGNFPKSRARLIRMVENLKPAPTLFISGDRHIAEISKLRSDKLSYPIYDVTSSGLTHTWSQVWEEKNHLRIGELIIQKNYGVLEIDWTNDSPKVTFLIKGKNSIEYLRHNYEY
ncbi:MAG: alkaline phosphatase D family protein [Bacteroidota bacterium]